MVLQKLFLICYAVSLYRGLSDCCVSGHIVGEVVMINTVLHYRLLN